jgi:biotin transport system substrate-specific component
MRRSVIYLGYALLGAAAIAGSAQVALVIPGFREDIPVTLQSLAILLVGYWLPRRYAAWAVVLYLLAGVAGLPVFSRGGAGVEVLKGLGGGYLLGFIPAAYVVSFLAESGWRTQWKRIVANFVVGTAIILTFGCLRIALDGGLDDALFYGFFPLLPGAILKLLAGSLLAWAIDKWYRNR